MTPLERALWLRVTRRAQQFEPELRAAFLYALQVIRDAFTDAEITALIQARQLDTLLREVLNDTLIERATLLYRQRLRRVADRAFQYTVPDLPAGGMVNGTITVSFDHLSPKVIDAIRALDTRVLQSMTKDVREVVRAFVENGLRDGVNPRVMARNLRGVIGLGPTQLQEVENYRDALNGVNGRNVKDYTLRDKRLNPKTPEQIDKAVEAYRKRRIAQNAETNARTATLDAFKQGQRLAWQDAMEKGIVDGDRLYHQWIGVMDDRERPEHIAMEKEIQPFDAPYTNGEMVPGESTYNCRCLDRIFVGRA